MKAAVGDRIVMASNQVDRPVRDGRIIEVRSADGSPPYVVEWSDTGQTGLVFPGPDAHVEPAAASSAPPAPAQRRVRSWRVQVDLYETGADTTAHAVLVNDAATPLTGEGSAHRRDGDPDVPAIGDEVAAARALRRLADRLLEAASADLTEVEGQPVHLPG